MKQFSTRCFQIWYLEFTWIALSAILAWQNYPDQNNFDNGQSYALHFLMKLDFILAP